MAVLDNYMQALREVLGFRMDSEFVLYGTSVSRLFYKAWACLWRKRNATF